MSVKAKISGSVGMHRRSAASEGEPRVKRAPEGIARCCAGFPSPAEQYLEPPLDLNELLVKRPAATYFVRVEGDSMIEAGIHDGDLLVVDRSLRPASGDIIIASVDGDFTVKTLRLGNGKRGMGNDSAENNREIRLVAANPHYPDIILKSGQELDYFGTVTACIHQFKRITF